MSPRMAPLALVVALLLTPTALGVLPDPTQPLAAVAFVSGSTTTVSWTPGPEGADTYRIYGLTAEGMAWLSDATPDETSVLVPVGYSGYAVTGIKNGQESEATRALIVRDLTDPPQCIGIEPGPPPYIVTGNCKYRTAPRVKVLSPLLLLS